MERCFMKHEVLALGIETCLTRRRRQRVSWDDNLLSHSKSSGTAACLLSNKARKGLLFWNDFFEMDPSCEIDGQDVKPPAMPCLLSSNCARVLILKT